MQPVLRISNLHQYFERGTVNQNHVLRGINLSLAPGEFVTIIGGNGAGKSTLLNSVAGTLPVEEGQLFLNEEEMTKHSVTRRSKKISRVFQDPKMGTAVRLSVEENLALAMKRGHKRGFSLGVKNKDRSFFQEQLAMLNLNLENRLDANRAAFWGQRQAITLLMATLQRPDLILLDEHTAALDPKTSLTVMELTERLIREQELTAFMVTHNMEDAIQYGNRLIMLHQGQIALDLNNQKNK
ncbi:ABC transporter ATP-binding protein, partial [Enterococcus pseudoavium]